MFSISFIKYPQKTKAWKSLTKHKFSVSFKMAYAMSYNGVNLSIFSIQLYRNTAFSQSEHAFSKSYFTIEIGTQSRSQRQCTLCTDSVLIKSYLAELQLSVRYKLKAWLCCCYCTGSFWKLTCCFQQTEITNFSNVENILYFQPSESTIPLTILLHKTLLSP